MKKATLLIFAAVVITVSGCGKNQSRVEALGDGEYGIIGGDAVKRGDELSKSTVGIYLSKARTHKVEASESYCTGTLIAPRLILTAAHCMDKNGQTPKHVIFYVKGKKIVSVKSIHTIPTREANKGTPDSHDVAVLLLKDDAPSGAVVVPLVPATEMLRVKNEVLYVAGIGRSKASGEMSGPRKKGVKLGAYGEGFLRKDTLLYGGPFGTTKAWTTSSNEVLCPALKPGEKCVPTKERLKEVAKLKGGPCNGDSGGPVYLKVGTELMLLATMTSVSDVNNCRAMTYVTLVGAHQVWIEQMIAWSLVAAE